MNIETIRNYCLSKKSVTESFPFDDETLVFKVGNKMFLLMSIDDFPLKINIKTKPEKSIFLREKFSQITPGYHMNKKHWNTIKIDGSIEKKLVMELIDESYDLIVKSLTRKKQDELGL